MAPDLLSTIRHEIDERLSELRPFLAEYEQLLVAADALLATGGEGGSGPVVATTAPVKRARRGAQARPPRRGSATGAIKRAAVPPPAGMGTGDEPNAEGSVKSSDVQASIRSPGGEKSVKSSDAIDARSSSETRKPSAKKPDRAVRGAAREAILAALDHGSHTVGELSIVTAMSAPNINGNLRKLLSEGAVIKTEREGKAAWALADTHV